MRYSDGPVVLNVPSWGVVPCKDGMLNLYRQKILKHKSMAKAQSLFFATSFFCRILTLIFSVMLKGTIILHIYISRPPFDIGIQSKWPILLIIPMDFAS